ncbi:rod shape-determining protein MreC [bacterium]|nr:rod shape-determining protein MreC [bacterium]
MIWCFRREIIFAMCLFFSILLTGRSYVNKIKSIEKEGFVKEKINYGELIAENARLREILNIKKKETYFSSFAVGGVTSVNPYVFPAEIFVNKGSDDGIREGMCAVSKELFLVGRVTDVKKNSSKITTIFNSSSKVSVIVETTEEIGIMEGGTVPLCPLKFISNESKIKKKDRILTSGYSDFFPKGLIVGEVVTVTKVPDSLFFHIQVKPYTCVSRMDEVLIGE